MELEIKALKGKVFDLESEMERSLASSFLAPVSFMQCFSSTPLLHSSSSSIEDTKNSPNHGSRTKKRKILRKCKEVMVSLKDVCGKYEESVSCVLGNSFIFGASPKKEEVRDII